MNSKGRVSKSMRVSCTNCCVVGCHNNYANTDENVKFYSFPSRPHELERRELWIKAVKRKRSESSDELWQPKAYSRICSQHFLGNKKSNHPSSPAYIPTLFPEIYNESEQNTNENVSHARKKKIRHTVKQIAVTLTEGVAENISTQVNFGITDTSFVFYCQRNSQNEVATWCNITRTDNLKSFTEKSLDFEAEENQWTAVQIEALIDEYRKYPALYNRRHEEYYNENVKNECLTKIVEALQSVRSDVSETDVIFQWKNLVVKYVQAQQAQKTQTCDSDKEFWCFQKMEFLQSYVDALNIKSEQFDEEEQWEYEYGHPLASNVRVKDEVEELPSLKSEVDDPSFSEDTETKCFKDADEIFGEFVVSQLRNITDEDVKQNAIFQMHQILHQALKETQSKINVFHC